MDLQLRGRRVLVTGSSSGIGEGIARMLASEGARVIVHGRNRERAEQVAKDIGAAGIALGELSNDEGAESVYAQAVAGLGASVEILVNNAGGTSSDTSNRPPLQITIPEWLETYQGNTLAAVRMVLHCVPAMVEAKWGRVIQISSAVALQPNGLGPDYTGAKSSLNNFTVSLAGSLHGAGVTVNTVTPGIIVMDGLIRWGREQYGDAKMTRDDVIQRMVADKIFDMPPAGRLGAPEDVAAVVSLLASPLSGFVTGSNYRVDGGQVRSVL